jgi:hypothetical protein
MSTEAETAKPGLGAGLAIVVIVVIAIIAWIALGSALHLTSLYAGFLFLWYWSTVQHLDMKAILPSLVGALIGVGLGFLVHFLPEHYGTAGLIAAIAAILVALYLTVIERVPFAFNSAAMLYLTVIGAPAILTTTDFRELAFSTALGSVFFAAFVFLVLTIAGKFSKAEPTAA